jgi:hypothetical protein
MKSIKPRKTRARFLEFCRYLRSLYLRQVIHDHMAKIAAHPRRGCFLNNWTYARL